MKTKSIKNPKKTFLSHKLEEIDMVKFMTFVVMPELEERVKLRIGSLGGRVLSVHRALGVSGTSILAFNEEVPQFVIFATARSEDAQNILLAIATEFNFQLPKTGKAWLIDVEGYMGAKGVLSE